MSQEKNRLPFEAGRAAANRGWQDAQVVDIEALDDQTPTGPALVIAAESHLVTPDTAKTLAALTGAGRHVLLVTDQPLPDDVNSWLPADTVVVIGQEPDSAPPVTIDRRTQLQHIILTDTVAAGNILEREFMAGNPNTPPDILARLADDPQPCDQDVLLALAGNPNTPPDILARLADDDYLGSDVAGNPNTPPEVLARLAADPSLSWRRSVANNPHTPQEVLARLADDPDNAVRIAVVGNPHTPPQTLTRLAQDLARMAADYDVRPFVEQHPHTPADILAHLAGDPGEHVREAVASERHTPPDVLARLADDPHELVRRSVAKNPNTPPQTLARLADDDSVSGCVSGNPNTPPQVLDRLADEFGESLAHNPNTPPQVLTRLADDPDEYVREAVTHNPNTPPQVLDRLAGDPDENVSMSGFIALVQNPAGPMTWLEQMAQAFSARSGSPS